MAKSRYMTTEIRNLITRIHLDHPDWRAKEVQKEVNRILGSDYPGLSAVQKQIKSCEDNKNARSPELKELDRPWCVLDMAKYPIPPETLPVVLEAWARELLKDGPLTIREVLWIARLYYVSIDRKEDVILPVPDGCLQEEPLDDIGAVTWSAKFYAEDELICEVTGKRRNKPEDMWWDWYRDSGLYQLKWGEGAISEKAEQEFEKRPHLRPDYARTRLIFAKKTEEAQNERSHNQEE